MASLLGKADPTLVTAAARASLANVPGDYSKQFGIMADASKTLLSGVEEAFKQHETGLKVDKLKLDTAISDLQKYGAGIENNADSKKFQGEMDGQYNIYKENGGFKNDRLGFNEWERQNNKIMSKYKNNKTMLIEAVEAYQSSDSWIDGLNKSDVGYLNNLTVYARNAGDKSGIHNEKADKYMANNTGAAGDITPDQLWKHLGAKEGEMVKYHDPVTNEFAYITSVDGKVISKKSSEISKMIPQKAIKPETDIHTEINAKVKASKGTYSDNDSQTTQNWLESLIDNAIEGNPRALEYLMGQKYGGMEMSFIESLGKGKAEITPAILTALKGLGYKGDLDKDGKFSRGDFIKGFIGEANYQTMVQEILYGEDNYELRRNLFVDAVDAEAFRPAIEQGGKKKTDVDFYKNKVQKLDGSDWNSSSVTGVYEDILAGREFTEKDPNTKEINVYSYHDGNWYQNWKQGDTPETKESYIGSGGDLGRIFTNDIRFRDIKTGGVKKQSETQAIDAETDKKINISRGKSAVPNQGYVPRQKGKKVIPPVPIAETVGNSGLENITEDSVGDNFRYYNYIGDDIEAANTALVKAKTAGINDAFIKYENNGKQISPEAYAKLKDKSNATIKVQLGIGKKSIVEEDAETAPVITPRVVADTTITPSDSTVVESVDESEKVVTEVTPPSVKLKPLEELSDEDIENLSDDERKQYGLLDEVSISGEKVEYGVDNPHGMFGSFNSSGDQMIGLDGEWIKIGSAKYFKSLGIKSTKGKAFVKGKGVMKRVSEIASNHDFNPRQLLDIFRNESSFDTRGRNKKGGATGLIQFFKDPKSPGYETGESYKTINGVKYKLDDIREMSVLEQLDLVDEYFTEMHTKGEHPYVTVAMGKSLINLGMDDVYATSDSTGYPGRVWRDNKAWRNEDGNVTKRSIIEYGEKKA